jgi:hypothetical protein
MGNKQSTVGVYEADLDRINILSVVTGKSQIDLMHELLSDLETVLQISVENQGKLGNRTYFYTLMSNRVGNKLTLTFVPKAKLVAEKVPMDSDAPSVNEMEKKLRLT